MIADLDTDGNGTIDFNEWFTLMTKRVNDKDSRANINKIFALYDDERTGYISAKNLRRIAQELGENISEDEINELIHRADIDQDGLVSEEEFYTIVTRKIKDWIDTQKIILKSFIQLIKKLCLAFVWIGRINILKFNQLINIKYHFLLFCLNWIDRK